MLKYVMTALLPMVAMTASALYAQADPAPAKAPAPEGTRIVLLGTQGGPTANAGRSEPANLLIVNGTPYLIDAGAGVSHQLAKADYPPPSIHTVFITHHHLDHTAGLEPFMSLYWIGTGLAGKATPVNIYGPPATDFLVKAALDYLSVSERIFRTGIPSLPKAEDMVIPHVIDHDGPAYKDANIRVTAAENTHFSHPSYGPDGKKDMSFSYRFDTPSGSVVFTGDTGPSAAVDKLAKGADVLVSEVYMPIAGTPESGGTGPAASTPLKKQLAAHMATEHLSPQEVGKLATKAGVKTVILTHIVATPSPDLAAKLKAGVHETFSGQVIVGHDLMAFDLVDNKVEQQQK